MKLTGVFPQVKAEKVEAKKSEGVAVSKDGKVKGEAADRVELSAGSLDVQKAKNIIEQTPEIRMDKVQALQEQIARGEYTVDPHRLADTMMASLLSENPLH